MVTKNAFSRLQPFLKRKSARQQLILFLIAEGYTVGELVKMSVNDLRQVTLGFGMDVTRDEVLEGRRSGNAFIYPSAKPLPHTAYYRLLRRSAVNAIGRPMSQEQFREWVNK